jgi:hypothetical protein
VLDLLSQVAAVVSALVGVSLGMVLRLADFVSIARKPALCAVARWQTN